MPECTGDFQFQQQVIPKCVCPVFLGPQIFECEALSDRWVSHCPVTWQLFSDTLFSSQKHFYNYKDYFWAELYFSDKNSFTFLFSGCVYKLFKLKKKTQTVPGSVEISNNISSGFSRTKPRGIFNKGKKAFILNSHLISAVLLCHFS